MWVLLTEVPAGFLLAGCDRKCAAVTTASTGPALGESMGARKWWRLSAILAAVAASVTVAAPASSTEVPVVTSPAEGAEVWLGYRGPITIDYSGVAPGTYKVEVASYEGGLHHEVLPDIQVSDSTTHVGVRLVDSLDKPGRYTVRTWLDGAAPETSSTFTVEGGEPPVILSPGRRVPLGQPWTFKIDWSKAPLGYYNLDLYRVGSSGSCCEFWEEMFPNHEDLFYTQRSMDPIARKGRYYVQIAPLGPLLGTFEPTRQYFQVS